MNIYRILLVVSSLLAFAAAVSEEALAQMLQQLRDVCVPQIPDLSEEMLDKLATGDETDVVPNSVKVMCYMQLPSIAVMLILLYSVI